MTISTGLVSVSFRRLDVLRIALLAERAGLEAIEWGADVHVPPGDIEAAHSAKVACARSNLAVSAYGSYYRAGATPPEEWEAVLQSGVALGAPTIRVWAGNTGSGACTPATRKVVASDINRICEMSAKRDIGITIEYHGGTLTDTLESAVQLFKSIRHPNFRTGWQPRDSMTAEAGAAEIRHLRPWLGNVHVFQWWPTGATRHSLSDGFDRWQTFLRAIADDGVHRFALLEFFKDDSPHQMFDDAETLRHLLRQVSH